MHFNFLKTSRAVKKHKILNMHSSEEVTVLYECIDVHIYKKIKVLKRISKLKQSYRTSWIHNDRAKVS